MRANRSFDTDTHRQRAARRAAGACRSTPTLDVTIYRAPCQSTL
jgi:hypothetical protein